jgi:aminoglycoside phosphotransferase (APT) family kinase protein
VNILDRACAVAGIDSRGAYELAVHANTVYLLPRADAVVRLRHTYGSTEWARRLSASVQVTRWLANVGMPVTVPLEVQQPVELNGWVATFWRREHLDEHARRADVVDLARLLRELHALPTPPVKLPALNPLGSLLTDVERDRPGVLTNEQHDWLRKQADQVTEEYARIRPPLSQGLIHGDARTGNLFPVGDGYLLGDWDSISTGPQVQDLVPTALGHIHYGHPHTSWQRFCHTYGVNPDLENDPAVRLLCRARELRSLAAFIRTAANRPQTAAELTKRLRTLMGGHAEVWSTN